MNRLEAIQSDIFRLEFNEKQQAFHCDHYSKEPNTYGWQTITEECTSAELWVFESFIDFYGRKARRERVRLQEVKGKWEELYNFIANMKEYNLCIQHSSDKERLTPFKLVKPNKHHT